MALKLSPSELVSIDQALQEMIRLFEGESVAKKRQKIYREAKAYVDFQLQESKKDESHDQTPPELSPEAEELIRSLAPESEATGAHRQVPGDIIQLLDIPELDNEKSRILYSELGVKSFRQLAYVARQGYIRRLPSFDESLENKILHRIHHISGTRTRWRWADAQPIAQAFCTYLEQCPDITSVAIAGSFRRGAEAVTDLDMVVATEKTDAVAAWVKAYPELEMTLHETQHYINIVHLSRIPIDIHLTQPDQFGLALANFTGNDGHIQRLRRLAEKQGLQPSGNGLKKDGKVLVSREEKDFYHHLGLPYISPALRENRGEVEAAQNDVLPSLVTYPDLKGDLHSHTTDSDGSNTLIEMVSAAEALGYEYLAITNHSKRMVVANGMDENRLAALCDQIDELNSTRPNIRILKGIEVDIMEDGSLDFSDEVLGRLDIVVASIHYKFDLSREKQTTRILRALERPYLTILAHPTGRLILEREAYELNMERVIEGIRARGCYLELNSNPLRLDLMHAYCQMAKEAGILVSINSDAHSIQNLGRLHYGINEARRAWLEPKDVLNTRRLEELLALFDKTRLK